MRARIAGRMISIAFPLEYAAGIMPLLRAERAELEAVFGAPVRFMETPPPTGPRWIVEVATSASHNTLRWDDATVTLTSVVRDADGFLATLQMLHSLVALQTDEITDAIDPDLDQAATRIYREIERGSPGLAIRDLTMSSLEYGGNHPIELSDVERMVAKLQDAHTSVRQAVPVFNPPYAVSLTATGAVLKRVPTNSEAYAAGVRVGWMLEIDDPSGWLERTGAPPHVHDLVAGRRAIALNGVDQRVFSAVSPSGERRAWTEIARPYDLANLMSSEVVGGSLVYVQLQNWIAGLGIEERFTSVIAGYRAGQRLVLDLRGNTGGNLLMAQRMRRRFLHERTLLGTIQFTRGDGTLADPVELWNEPAEEGIWPGELVVLTDGLTYSASEDFLQGLQGLPHVTVIGQRSGGGSGRPRTLPLIPGWNVTMSTALTFDRTGHCIEGQWIPVDIETDPFVDDWRDMISELF